MLYLALYLLSWRQYQAPVLALPAALAGLQLDLLGLTLPKALSAAGILALISVPGFAVKQLVNVVQLRTAAQQLAAFDQSGAQKRAA